MKNAVVIGAGFTGLVTAYYLERSGHSVEVYDRNPIEGGLLGTTLTEFGISESGANAFLNSARVEALFEDLGISLIPAKPESRKRFIFRNGLPRRWPIGFFASLRVVFFVLRYLLARESVRPKPAESLETWGKRTLGDEATAYLLLPAFQGIYAGEGSRLSATLLLSTLFSAKRGGAKPSVRGSISADAGMGELTAKLRERLESKGVRFHFGVEGPILRTENLTYFCGSASQAAVYLGSIAPELARAVGKIEMLPVVSVTAFFKADPRVRLGFGVLFPPREKFQSLGVLYNHAIFPGRVARPDLISETWILGGALHPGVTGQDDSSILSDIFRDRRRLNGYTHADPVVAGTVFHRWVKGLPYYTVELEKALEEISRLNRESSTLRLMGNYLGGIGLTKILDRIADEIGEGTSK
jgi:oxygen-dependent protoporphyrinogen oxidase